MNLLCVGGPRGGRVVSDLGVECRFPIDQILLGMDVGDGLVVKISNYRYIKRQFHYNGRVADVYLWEHSNPNVGMELIMDALGNLGETK
jgi:hypothetical protein